MRSHTPESHAALKTAFRLLVRDVGGLEAAASLTRVRTSELARYYDPASASWPPADVVADLEAASPAPHVTAVLARLAQHRLAALGGLAEAGSSRAIALASTLHRTGEFCTEYAVSLADGHINAAESARLADLLSRLLVEAEQALRACNGAAGSAAAAPVAGQVPP